MTLPPPGHTRWLADLEARHLRDLTPTEVARALRALSSTYVERRARLSGRGAFDTAGKRAAYALYYAPRRFETMSRILAALPDTAGPRAIIDAGCGTGAAVAAWALHTGPGTAIQGFDPHPWAVDETRATLAAFGIRGDVRRGAIGGPRGLAPWLQPVAAPRGVVLSYVVNELSDDERHALLPGLLAAARLGTRVLVMEPLSRKTSPWWPRWADAFATAGGRADEWRFALRPPDLTTRLGRAAGLDPFEATGRTLWL